jgi:hypothetical protein
MAPPSRFRRRSLVVLAAAVLLSAAASAFAADQSAPSQPSVATAADIDKLDGRRFDFSRFVPLQTFSDVRINLRVPGNWPDASVDDPLRHGTNEASGAHAQSTATATPTSTELRIVVNGLDLAGDYDLPVHLGGPPPGRQITIGIHASDGWLFPLLAVCLGVGAGLWSRHLVRQRPLQELQADIARARARIQRLRARAPTRRAEFDEYAGALHEIEIDAAYRQDIGTARGRFNDLVAKLGPLDKQREKERDELRTWLNERARLLDVQSGRWVDPNDDEEGRINGLIDQLRQLRSRLDEGYLDEVEDARRGWMIGFGELMRQRALRFSAEMEHQMADWPEANRQGVRTELAKISQRLQAGSLAIAENIAGLNDGIAAVERAATAKGGKMLLAEPEVGRRQVAAAAVTPTADTAAADQAPEVLPLNRLRRSMLLLTLVSAVVAIITGWPTIYLGKAFGGWADYITAFVWGYGMDAATRTVNDVTQK